MSRLNKESSHHSSNLISSDLISSELQTDLNLTGSEIQFSSDEMRSNEISNVNAHCLAASTTIYRRYVNIQYLHCNKNIRISTVRPILWRAFQF